MTSSSPSPQALIFRNIPKPPVADSTTLQPLSVNPNVQDHPNLKLPSQPPDMSQQRRKMKMSDI